MNAPLRHIFCVDDESDILDVAQMSLEVVGGYTVETFETGAEVLFRLRDARPDLVILDVMMPEMNGPTVLENIRKMKECNGLPVVFMTARNQPSEVKSYLKSGAVAVVAKPFNPMSLPTEINQIWEDFHGEYAVK
jgi:two-component system, OmpR family, response regulator